MHMLVTDHRFTHDIYPQMGAMPVLTHQLQSITALWPVLISHSTESRRLSWHGGWLQIEEVCLPKSGQPSQY